MITLCRACHFYYQTPTAQECIDCDMYYADLISMEINITNYIPRGRQREANINTMKGKREKWQVLSQL
jgi:hypothetical protein